MSDSQRIRGATRKPVAKYREAIVTFIDILGFRRMVEKDSAEEISKIIGILQRYLAGDDEDYVDEDPEEVSWTRALYFSDSVVHIRPIDVKISDGALFYQVNQLLLAQVELANRGVLIRGGLTVGKIYSEDTMLFGPAMVRAYDLESKFANYPRIVIDPEAIQTYKNDERLRSEMHTLAEDSEYINNMLRRGEDGLYFIDYLNARSEFDHPGEFPNFLEGIKSKIVKEIAAASGNLTIVQKYLWLANYLNLVASEHVDCRNDAKITINDKDIPEFAEVLVVEKKKKSK